MASEENCQVDPGGLFTEWRATGETGTVTRLLHKYQEADTCERDQLRDDLFTATVEQLTAKASRILRKFPGSREEPASLASRLWEKLGVLLSDIELENRRAFFSLAGTRFRYMLLDEMKTIRRRDESSLGESDVRDSETGPATSVERMEDQTRLLEAIENLSKEHQRVVNCRVFLGMTFQQIAEELHIPRATASDKYQQAVCQLRHALQS